MITPSPKEVVDGAKAGLGRVNFRKVVRKAILAYLAAWEAAAVSFSDAQRSTHARKALVGKIAEKPQFADEYAFLCACIEHAERLLADARERLTGNR